MNISKDAEDDQSKYELLLRFINPRIAIEAFDRTIEETEVGDDDFLKEVNAHTVNPVKSIDDITVRQQSHEDKFDKIERVD